MRTGLEVPWTDGFYLVKLVRHHDGGEEYVDVLAAASHVADPEQALRAAVEGYLRSPESWQALKRRAGSSTGVML